MTSSPVSLSFFLGRGVSFVGTLCDGDLQHLMVSGHYLVGKKRHGYEDVLEDWEIGVRMAFGNGRGHSLWQKW